MVVKVRQREYAIGFSGKDTNELLTHNIWTCTGFAGVSTQGISFLAHFDSRRSTEVLPQLIADLKKQEVKDFSDFKLAIVTGCAGGVQCCFTRRTLRARLKELGVFPSIPDTTYFTKWGLHAKGGIRVNTEQETIELYGYDDFVERKRYEPDPWYRRTTIRTMVVEDETQEELNAPKRE